MEITKEMLNSYKMQLKGEIEQEEVNKRYKEKYDYLKKNVELKGFRKGKAPLSLIKAKLDEAFTEEFANEIAEEYINNYIKENDIKKISQFELKESDLAEDKPFNFIAEFEIIPEIDVSEDIYKGIKLTRKDDEATEDEINNILEGYRAQKAVNKPYDGPVDADTMVYGDLEIKSIENPDNTFEKEDFHIAKGTYIIGEEIFDDLMGKNAGDVYEKELSFHSDFYGIPANEKCNIKFNIKSLKKQDLPPLNDDLAQQIDEDCNTLEDLKNQVKDDIEKRKKKQNRHRIETEIDDFMSSKIDIELPPKLIDFELQKILYHYQLQMAQYNIGFNSEEEKNSFIEARKSDAAKLAKINLITDAIIKKEEIDASFKEVKSKIDDLIKDEENASELRKDYFKEENFEYMKHGLIKEKLYDFIIENAEFIEKSEEIDSKEETREE